MTDLSRRRLLRVIAAGSAGVIAGCSDGGSGAPTSGGTVRDDGTSEAAGTETETGTGGRLATVEGTGEQSAEQTTNRIRVVSAVGTDIASGRVRTVELVVGRSPGATAVDLGSVTLQWVGPSGVKTLTAGETPGGSTFAVSAVQDDDGSVPTLNSANDRAKLTVDVTAVAGSGLAPGASVTVTLTAAAAGETTLRLNVPETLAGKRAVSL